MRMFTTTVSIATGVLLLGACSGGGGSAGASEAGAVKAGAKAGATETEAMTFCQGAEALYEQFVSAGITDPSSSAMREVFEDAYSLEAPAEIAEDWEVILESIEPLATGKVDMSDPAAMERLSQQTTANAGSYERVGVYTSENCGLGPETPTTVTTTPGSAITPQQQPES